jgi:hypothetical protein
MKAVITLALASLVSLSAAAAEKPVECFTDADAATVLASMKNELVTSTLKARAEQNLERIKNSLTQEQVQNLNAYNKEYTGADAEVLQGKIALELSKIIGSNECNQEISPAVPNTVNMTCEKQTSYGFASDQIITNNGLGQIISTSTKMVRVPLSNGVIFEYNVTAQTEERYQKRGESSFWLSLGFIERPNQLWIRGQTVEDASFQARGVADFNALSRLVKERQQACIER